LYPLVSPRRIFCANSPFRQSATSPFPSRHLGCRDHRRIRPLHSLHFPRGQLLFKAPYIRLLFLNRNICARMLPPGYHNGIPAGPVAYPPSRYADTQNFVYIPAIRLATTLGNNNLGHEILPRAGTHCCFGTGKRPSSA